MAQKCFLGLIAAATLLGGSPAWAQHGSPPVQHARLLVLSDIEADPDDSQSLIRLLLYSNEIDLEGLVATTSVHKKTQIAPDSIRALLRVYDQVQPNLLLHDPNYPTARSLEALVEGGQPVYGMAGVGAGKDTPGSDRIIASLERSDDRPLWVTAWGGPNTLAQALYTIRATRPPEEVARLVAKLRVYTISDQDDSGPWMRQNFPDLFYVVSPGGYGAATWTGISQVIDGLDNTTIANSWLTANIQQGHGPLGAAYPDVAYGLEGDTPSFLALIPNGLSDPEHPDWGGWGGRYELYTPALDATDPKGFNGGVPVPPETRPIWTNAVDAYIPMVAQPYNMATGPGPRSFSGNAVTVWRWRDDFQNDFAARMDWTTKTVAEANHPPVVAVTGGDRITAHSGDAVSLNARRTIDPDGDNLSYIWSQYVEAGTHREPITLWGAANLDSRGFIAPDVTEPQTLHFILRVTDKGSPPLSRYRRVIVTVLPRPAA